MRIKLLSIFFVLFSLIIFTPVTNVNAVENPFSSFNNKFGIHILFPEELSQAADLVNSNGGDWGYVIIPIQSGDQDLVKWQLFMNSAKRNHLIPIIRLATEGDYFNTKVWRKPDENDIVDFANFLNSLEWPVKNRYIVVFNEVNRGDEWGGSVNPTEYANLLNYAITVFKTKSPDFFMINAGLDNAAPNALPQYQNEYDFLREMDTAVPGIFKQLDGLASHSYPNPAFAQPPTSNSKTGVMSFDYERKLVKSLNDKDLPVFITETGWSLNAISDLSRADYYQYAFKNIWKDNGIAAVTPFLLRANGSFTDFSFLDADGSPTYQYKMIKAMPKVKGMPVLSKTKPVLLQQQKKLMGLIEQIDNTQRAEASTYRDYSKTVDEQKRYSLTNMSLLVLHWLIGS